MSCRDKRREREQQQLFAVWVERGRKREEESVLSMSFALEGKEEEGLSGLRPAKTLFKERESLFFFLFSLFQLLFVHRVLFLWLTIGAQGDYLAHLFSFFFHSVFTREKREDGDKEHIHGNTLD